MVVDKRK